MTTSTYSLEEYAAALLGPGPDGTAATVEPFKIQWLAKRLRGHAEPVLPGYKAGRKWRGTQEDVDTAIELMRPQRVCVPEVPHLSGMTRTTRRRLAS
jgi:hypothetical protein